MSGPVLYYVTRAIPEIGARPSDVLIDDPTDGLSLIRRVPIGAQVLSAYSSSLQYLPRPGSAGPPPEPKKPPIFITTPPVEGWQ